ncbi:MAG: hypothetical protein NVSMB38_40260 [Ktedonobacteraceae bacterium]
MKYTREFREKQGFKNTQMPFGGSPPNGICVLHQVLHKLEVLGHVLQELIDLVYGFR